MRSGAAPGGLLEGSTKLIGRWLKAKLKRTGSSAAKLQSRAVMERTENEAFGLAA
jgi:hypothetical protein